MQVPGPGARFQGRERTRAVANLTPETCLFPDTFKADTSILPVMSASRDAVLRGGPVYGDGGLDAVAEAEQFVGHGAAPVEVLDLDLELREDPPGSVEALLRAEQPHVVPHRVADDHPVLGDERRVHGLVLRVPG